MKVEIPNVSPLLIKNTKKVALSTTYEFKSNMTYYMTTSQNELESGRKQFGTMVIYLSTDSLLF